MKKKKFSSRLLAFFLALSMAFTIMPAVNAMADSKSTASNKLKIPKLKNVKTEVPSIILAQNIK